MTAPIVIRRKGFGEGVQQALSPLLDALAQRQQFGLEKQKIEIERQKAEASIAQAGTATAESRGRTKKLLEELKQKDIQLRASDLATERFISTLTSPEGLSAENISSAREELIRKGEKEISSEALVAFDALITANTDQQRKQAEAALATTEARVAGETAADRIRAGQLADEVTQADIAQRQAATQASEAAVTASEAATEASQVDARLAKLQEELDPVRVARAQSLWMTGNLTWGEARRAAGLAAGGIPDDEKFDPTKATAASGAGGEAARKAATFGRLMQSSGAIIDFLEEKTGGISFAASLQRQTKIPLLDILINLKISPDQRQLVNAHRTFGDAFRFSVSGQQSSDREALRMLNTVAGQTGDDVETRKQKSFIRRVMTQMTLDAAAGIVTPVEAMDEIIEQALLVGMDSKKMAVFREQRADAVTFMQRRAAGRGPLILNDQPTTADSLAGSVATIDSLFNNRFEVRR